MNVMKQLRQHEDFNVNNRHRLFTSFRVQRSAFGSLFPLWKCALHSSFNSALIPRLSTYFSRRPFSRKELRHSLRMCFHPEATLAKHVDGRRNRRKLQTNMRSKISGYGTGKKKTRASTEFENRSLLSNPSEPAGLVDMECLI